MVKIYEFSFLEAFAGDNREVILSKRETERLSQGSVLIVGAGGLGSPAALYLAAAGVGTIGIADGDRVELSNLQRQIIHTTKEVGRFKTESAKEKVGSLNSVIKVITYNGRVGDDNALDLFKDYQVVIDGTDNFPSKFLINDACYLTGVPLVHAGVLRFLGQVMTIIPGESACYRCIFLEPPPPEVVPTCSEAGVLGAMVGTMGAIQATEVLKYILGIGKLLTNRLLSLDALSMKWREIELKRNPNCPLCGKEPVITLKTWRQIHSRH